MSIHLLERLDLHHGPAGQPKHSRLKSFWMAELAAGRIKPGDSLPTEEQMAESLGIARSTVRRALSELEDEGCICRQQGRGTFVREDAFHQLNHQVRTFVLILPETKSWGLPLIAGFERACRAREHHMIVCDSENDIMRQANLVLQFMQKDIAGLAMLPTTDPPTPAYQVAPLQQRGIPVVFLHRGVQGIQAPLIEFPYENVGCLIGRALLARGHRRAALILPHPNQSMLVCERELAATLRLGGGQLPEDFIHRGNALSVDYAAKEQEIFDAVQRMCSREDRPTAIVSSPDDLAERIYMILLRLGFRIPEDISVVGLGDVCRDGALRQRLVAAVVDEAGFAIRAVELLEQMRAGSRPLESDEKIIMPCQLSGGESLGLVPQPPLRRLTPSGGIDVNGEQSGPFYGVAGGRAAADLLEEAPMEHG